MVVGLMWAGEAAAVCDEDGDGFYGNHPGCLPRLDCDDTPVTGAYVNPGEYEDADTVVDDNCNGRRGLVPLWVQGIFLPGSWVTSGVVSFTGDELSVGSQGTNSPASATKTITISLPVAAAVAVKVTHDAGAGSPCEARVSTPGATFVTLLDGVGIHRVELGGVYPTAPMGTGKVTSLQVACAGYRNVAVDWIQVQDDLEEFGPPGEATVQWKDTANPFTDEVISLVAGADGRVWFGTDTSGLGVWDSTGWHASNGYGEASLMMGGTLGVSGILPLDDESEEMFVLTGDSGNGTEATNLEDGTNAANLGGGFWRSLDDGETWEQLASTLDNWPPTTSPPASPDHSDDVGGYDLLTNCTGNKSGGRTGSAGEGCTSSRTRSPL